MTWLRQSTAVTVKIGPFVDSTDAVTAETALTIAQADIRLTKNGAAFAQTANVAGATHDENGYYGVPLDSTDTGTLGTLRVAVNESGALPVWQDFMIVPANVWDSMFGADKIQVDLTQVNGSAQTATLDTIKTQTAAIEADTQDLQTQVGTDGAGLTAVPWNASWDAEVQSEVADALAVYDPPTKAELDSGLAGLNDPTASAIADAVLDEALSGHITAGTFGKAVADIETDATAILEDTGTTIPGTITTVDTVADAIKAKTDNLTFTVAGRADANVTHVNETAVGGTGAAGNEWGPA